MGSQMAAESVEAAMHLGARKPTIAFLLPTLNELHGLRATLPFIDHPQVDDIYVIDGGSTDGTIEYAWKFDLILVSQLRKVNIYRGYRRKLILNPEFEFHMKGPVLVPLITGICALKGYTAAEIPGNEPQRIGGITKRSIVHNGLAILMIIVRLYMRKFLGRRI